VAIQPVIVVPSNSQIGCSTRDRGRLRVSTVATVAQTMRWAASMNGDAMSASAVIDPV
jgi:hypothetical protein